MKQAEKESATRCQTVVLNFTHTYDIEKLAQNISCRYIDCTHLNGTDCYCDQDGCQKLKQLFKPYSPHGIHWIDSGDYHYISKFWTDKIDYPFVLILFDHHPDMQPPLFENLLSCGSWVQEMLQTNNYLQKVCIIGASEKLRKETEDYKDKIIFFGEEYKVNKETWQLFAKMHLKWPVYLSIDKDVLSPKYAKTNWDQGSLSLPQLEKILDLILRYENVIGIDICGELPPALGGNIEDEYLNKKTNIILQQFIEKVWRK